ncbi:hypothetical protein CL689_04420 [Candidatus Saccharibacteria bacterium]|nr:hypothetical protein [Candidatus Saccharibacteria bacterium]|tara:strand:+ start:362 stop:661 length:300 start_codon:yes stop_codon:yes gene_type:complete
MSKGAGAPGLLWLVFEWADCKVYSKHRAALSLSFHSRCPCISVGALLTSGRSFAKEEEFPTSLALAGKRIQDQHDERDRHSQPKGNQSLKAIVNGGKPM